LPHHRETTMRFREGTQFLNEWPLPTSPPHRNLPVNVSARNTKGV